ncbi:MAG: hypothetical protein E2591_27105 [Achromobacter sp.]|uniref:hypothetical protein n=1 Tax=Achromobacter sp. TaxID=134375 RepID=UPI0012BE02E6|nr:hypothetical protein [Achromobacter sp.]MPS81745.1 hypothetical protein [Achromobacter sp.]
MSAGLLQEEASLRSRVAQLESEIARLRRTLDRAGISPDISAHQISELMPKHEHIAIVQELKRALRKVSDELTRERARNQSPNEHQSASASTDEDSDCSVDEADAKS